MLQDHDSFNSNNLREYRGGASSPSDGLGDQLSAQKILFRVPDAAQLAASQAAIGMELLDQDMEAFEAAEAIDNQDPSQQLLRPIPIQKGLSSVLTPLSNQNVIAAQKNLSNSK